MALMTLGMYPFDIPTLAYSKLQSRMTWQHATNERVGARAAGQYVGPGEHIISLTGTLAPIIGNDPQSLKDLREMADSGQAWPLLDGSGRNYGAFVITAIDEDQRSILDNGAPRIADFSISLQQMDDPQRAKA